MNNFKLKFLILMGEIFVFLAKAVELKINLFALFGLTIVVLIFRHKLLENCALFKVVFHFLDFLWVNNLGFDRCVIITA
jgi:hypothetical protein